MEPREKSVPRGHRDRWLTKHEQVMRKEKARPEARLHSGSLRAAVDILRVHGPLGLFTVINIRLNVADGTWHTPYPDQNEVLSIQFFRATGLH